MNTIIKKLKVEEEEIENPSYSASSTPGVASSVSNTTSVAIVGMVILESCILRILPVHQDSRIVNLRKAKISN